MNEDSIAAAALAKTNAAERAAFLEQACAGDTALRKRVEQRLATQESGTFHASTLGAGGGADYTSSDSTLDTGTSSSREGAGSLIGPYKLMQPIGAGGMGMVFLAEQQYPVRRQVALKIIKQGMDTEQVIARFEAERQALALMDHPNIAKVLDAGTTDSGRPYFVMELVRGVPITEYCDQNNSTPEERLNLFVQVCQAIQHAHQKGIIHRDIKDENVVLDSAGRVKVIDFGSAAYLKDGPFDTFHGTLDYASPEVLGGKKYTGPAQDVWAAGILLYTMIYKENPFYNVLTSGWLVAEFRLMKLWIGI